jgi:hypothetical protein
MKNKGNNGENFADALEKEHRYAVLTKTRRIQILVRPTTRQLRKRGKRGWRLFATVESSSGAGRTLIDTIQSALRETESTGEAAGNKQTKAKPSKASSV